MWSAFNRVFWLIFLRRALSCRHLSVSRAVGARQSGKSPGDREAQTVTNVWPHSYGSVYTETDRETTTNRGLLQKTLMIQRQRNRAEINTEKHAVAAVRGTSVIHLTDYSHYSQYMSGIDKQNYEIMWRVCTLHSQQSERNNSLKNALNWIQISKNTQLLAFCCSSALNQFYEIILLRAKSIPYFKSTCPGLNWSRIETAGFEIS